MDVPLALALASLLLGFVLMTVSALAEVSLSTISREHVRSLSDEGVSSAKRVEALLKDTERLLSGVLVLKTLAICLAVAAVTWLVLRSGYGAGVVWAVAAVALLLLLVQVWGRLLAVQHPVTVALRVTRPLRWLIFLITPVIWLLALVVRKSGPQEADASRNVFLTEDGLRLLLNFGEEERFIEDDEREMIDSIFRFSETTVEEVMVPRVDVIAIEQDASLQEALDTIVTYGHSRIPVYEDTIDKIVGVLYAKDLLTCYRDGRRDVTIKELMREPYFVPESAMVDDLLGDLQHRKTHLAIVVDEYGGTAGIVTIEDLLEEIVGEIQDEYDSEAPMLVEQERGIYIASGRADIDDINRELDIALPEDEESYTLAGMLYSHLQRVPDVGDTLDIGNVHLEVLRVNDNRIEQVKIVVEQPQEDETIKEAQ